MLPAAGQLLWERGETVLSYCSPLGRALDSPVPFAFALPLIPLTHFVLGFCCCLYFKILNVANVLQHFDGFTSCVLLLEFPLLYTACNCIRLSLLLFGQHTLGIPHTRTHTSHTHIAHSHSWPHNAAAFWPFFAHIFQTRRLFARCAFSFFFHASAFFCKYPL